MIERIIKQLGRKDYVPLNSDDLARTLRIPEDRFPEFQLALAELERQGRVARIKANRYVKSDVADLIPGRIRMNRQGKGFLQPDDPSLAEIIIPENAASTAMNEDRVLVRRNVHRGEEQNTGAVVRILERRRTRIVGTLQRSSHFLYVIPDDPRMPEDIYVSEPRDVGRPARVGDKVVVEMKEWQSRHTNPEGEVIEVLGSPDQEGVDMLSVIRQYDLPLHFPREVLDEANAIGNKVHEHEVEGRVDCRSHQVITIDPDDAKDFDDAICIQPGEQGEWRLWVHIADVSHYIKPGSALDVEARKRGNSTYLVDRVIPMLPEALSNELCSLKPHVDRLTKCVEFTLSHEGEVLSSRFYPAVIHSKRRYAYQEVFHLLHEDPAGPLEQMLHWANDLAQKIRRRRFRAGSLDLDFPERKIRLDEQGKVLRIEKVENDISHQLIEEYMLLANEAVAAKLLARKRAGIYRIHEEPNAQRLEEYREEVLSHNIPCGDLKKRGEVQRLLARLSQLPIGPALKIGFLKSLMRARYAPDPLGHYGLAKQNYTHFTSPIRRYADLIVHRAMFENVKLSKGFVTETSDHISSTERNSADAERDSKDVKLFAFLRAQLESGRPEEYAALVTDVRNFGFFVDVPDLAMSGLVHLSSLEDDFYIFDSATSQLVGRRTRNVIRLGDNLTVQVAKVDAFKKQVDFRLAALPTARPASRPARQAEPPRPQRETFRSSFRDRSSADLSRQERPAGARPAFSKFKGRRPQKGVRPAFRPGSVEESTRLPSRPGRSFKPSRQDQDQFSQRPRQKRRGGSNRPRSVEESARLPSRPSRRAQESERPMFQTPYSTSSQPQREEQSGRQRREGSQPQPQTGGHPKRKGKGRDRFRNSPKGGPGGRRRGGR